MELGPVRLVSGQEIDRYGFASAGQRPEDRAQAEERRALIKAVKELEASPQLGLSLTQEMTFAFDRSSRKTVVRIIDRETKEVVRQFPSEEILRMAERNRAR